MVVAVLWWRETVSDGGSFVGYETVFDGDCFVR